MLDALGAEKKEQKREKEHMGGYETLRNCGRREKLKQSKNAKQGK